MKINFNKNIMVLILILAISFVIRIYQLSFFEFKNDQYSAIILGNDARAAHFLVNHGMRASLGVDNPPLFSYVMGILTALTADPAQLTFYFFCINILALALAVIYFYCTLPGEYALLSASFLALFPAFTIYSNNIWAQCLLPLIIILFNISLYRFIKYELWQNFFYMSLLAILAAQLHGSGFLLFLLLVVIAIAYWKKMDKKALLLALLATAILFIPFLIYLLAKQELSGSFIFGTSTKRTFQWQIFTLHLRMASFDFLRNYFRHDFNEILKIIAGKWRFVLYPLTFIPKLLFMLGFVDYIRWLMKGKIFDKSEGNSQEYPIPFQISGLMILIVTFGYLILRVPLPMHYFIVLFPAYSVLTGFFAFKIWRSHWGKLVVLSGILSTLILLICTLLFLDRAGGHPSEYGVSYKSLISWHKEIQEMKQRGECLDLKVNFIGNGKSDVRAALAVLNENNKCSTTDKIIPAQINIIWNEKLMRYEHLITINKK